MRVTKTATVVATGVLTVSASAPAKGYNGVAISVSASWDGGAIGPFLGQINWGDGAYTAITSQTGKSVTKTHTYTTNGTYTITVAISDEGALTSGVGTASIQIAAPLAATLAASPTGGTVPLPVTFTLGMTGGYTPYSWTLDYADGSTPGSGTVAGTKAHTYTKVGSFTATLTVTDALGLSLTRAVTTFAGVPIPTLLDMATFALASIPLLVVGGVIGANELQKARVFG